MRKRGAPDFGLTRPLQTGYRGDDELQVTDSLSANPLVIGLTLRCFFLLLGRLLDFAFAHCSHQHVA